MNTPKPALPEPDKCRIELVTALYFLASNYENALGAFRNDAEARRKAEGDIAHARSIAAQWNQNGAIFDAAVAEARAEMQERIADQLRTIKALMVGMPDEGTTPVIRRIAWLEQQLAEARAVPDGWSISRQENGSIDIRGPGHIAVNVRGAEQSPRLIPTQVLYELAEAMLSATPSPAEQPKPAVVDLPDSIRVPLHRLWADAGYLIGRAKNGETDLAVHTIKALCDELERAIRAALQGEPHDQA